MANNITIDSSVLEGILSSINADKSKLEGVKSKLASSFSALTSAGLFEACLSSLQSEVSDIASTYDVLYSNIKSHVDEVGNLENEVEKVGNDYRSYYGASSGGGGGYSYSGDDNTVEEVEEGQSVDPEKLDKKVESLDINSAGTMLAFVSLVKESDTSLLELLFNTDKAEYFTDLLKKFYNTYGTLEVEYDDAKEVQKKFLKNILNSDSDLPAELTNVTILQFKTYLYSIAKENSTTTYDLLTDDKYKDILTTSLKKLYDGEVEEDQFEGEYALEFKAFVNTKANKKNKTAEEALADISNLL